MNKKDLIAINIVGVISGIFFLPVAKNTGLFELNPFFSLLFVAVTAVAANIGLGVFVLLAKWKKSFHQIGKYAAVGVLNTVLDFGVLNLLSVLTGIFSGALIAGFNVVSFAVANVNSYFWNRHWTFDRTQKGQMLEFSQFFGVSLVAIGINTLIVYLGTTYLLPWGDLTLPQWENVMKVVASGSSLIINFIGYKYWVFRS